MINNELQFPLQRRAPFHEWSPSIHYARSQRMHMTKLPPRRLYDFELLYVYQGEAATTIRGKRYELTAGQLIFLPSGVPHQNEATSVNETRFLGIHFDFFDELDIQTEADMLVDENNMNEQQFAVEAVSDIFPPLSSQLIYVPPLACIQLMEQLEHEFTMRPLGYELVCKALMLQILAYLLRLPLSRSIQHASQHDLRLLKLMEEIEEQPGLPWTNQSIAKRMNLSTDHAAKLFKQLAGMPPNSFIHVTRHREARRLLRETNMSIEQIGEQLGYSSIHYFSRLFRQHEGISATEYRKLSQIL